MVEMVVKEVHRWKRSVCCVYEKMKKKKRANE